MALAKEKQIIRTCLYIGNIVWFRVQFRKKHVRVSFSKTIKFEVFKKLTSICFVFKLHEKPYYYLYIHEKIMQSFLNVHFFVLFLLEFAVS